MLKDQSFCPSRFQLESFTESSFVSSWLFLESGGSQTPVSKINEDLSESDVKLKEEDNRQQEENLKKIKASAQVSHERYKEQLKSVKKKVRCVYISHEVGLF